MRKLRHEEISRPDPDEVASLPKHPISLVVDSVRSIYNVGAIFRTSDAAFIEHIYVTGISGTPDNPAVHKTALGAQDTVDWTYESNPVDAVRRLKAQGYTVGILEITNDPTATTDVALEHFPLCLVVGNELHGVDEAIVQLADLALEVPQFGAKQSLNVSVAYGIAVFDLVRRFRELKGLSAFPACRDPHAGTTHSKHSAGTKTSKHSTDAARSKRSTGATHSKHSTGAANPKRSTDPADVDLS